MLKIRSNNPHYKSIYENSKRKNKSDKLYNTKELQFIGNHNKNIKQRNYPSKTGKIILKD